MKASEANRIIAEFMGYYSDEGSWSPQYPLFDRSLDTLVPVWEKLKRNGKIEDMELSCCGEKGEAFWNCMWDIDKHGPYCEEGTNAQKIAAIATAKAITNSKRSI